MEEGRSQRPATTNNARASSWWGTFTQCGGAPRMMAGGGSGWRTLGQHQVGHRPSPPVVQPPSIFLIIATPGRSPRHPPKHLRCQDGGFGGHLMGGGEFGASARRATKDLQIIFVVVICLFFTFQIVEIFKKQSRNTKKQSIQKQSKFYTSKPPIYKNNHEQNFEHPSTKTLLQPKKKQSFPTLFFTVLKPFQTTLQ